MRQDVQIPMPDGAARAFVFTPDAGSGPWPAVIMFMDGPGIRPALFDMADRLAAAGYYVLLPDLFWRLGPYEPFDLKALFGSEEGLKAFRAQVMSATDPKRAMADTGAFLAWLDQQPRADARKIGVTGYCMGGSFVMHAAGTYPDRIAAAAAFHPSMLATDREDSPHRLAAKIRARVLVAGADEDRSFDEAQKDRLAAALEDAGVDAEVAIWKGLKHGWAPADMPVHDAAGAERHWQALLELFDETLKAKAPA
jgi:carboxymethylenebutenolidase